MVIRLTTIDQIFESLLTGDGAFIGFIIIASIMVLVTIRARIMAIPFIVCSAMISVYCLNNIAVDSMYMWVMILYALNIFILIVTAALKGQGSAF